MTPAVSPQVAGVLELLMGDVCQPFYYDALGLERVASKRRALRVFFSLPLCGQMYIMATELFCRNNRITSLVTYFFFPKPEALKLFNLKNV